MKSSKTTETTESELNIKSTKISTNEPSPSDLPFSRDVKEGACASASRMRGITWVP